MGVTVGVVLGVPVQRRGCGDRCGNGCGAGCDRRCGQLHVVIVGVVML